MACSRRDSPAATVSCGRQRRRSRMLEGTVLHKSRSGARGDGDVVGISWKAPTRSHPSPSLVVTCAHQVVVYKVSAMRALLRPGEV